MRISREDIQIIMTNTGTICGILLYISPLERSFLLLEHPKRGESVDFSERMFLRKVKGKASEQGVHARLSTPARAGF